MADAGMHDHGCGRLLRLRDGVSGSAVFGGEREEYRYRLSRWWTGGLGVTALFVMMNASGAGPLVDDATVAKVQRYCLRWGDLGGTLQAPINVVLIGNVFAYRAKDQHRLAEVDDPVGPNNDQWLMSMAKGADLVVMAYGAPKHARLRQRGPAVARRLARAGIQLHVLRLGARDTPCHPLYLPETLLPTPWVPAGDVQ